jgi:alpha/beta superfamily hydrolase
MVSILAKRDTVVDNTPVYELKKVAKEMELYEIDDEHPLRNKLNELERLLRNILIQRTG